MIFTITELVQFGIFLFFLCITNIKFYQLRVKFNHIIDMYSVLSISFEVDVPTGKVGGSLFFECQRCKLPRGVWGHAPPENFEI